ncbi:phosphoglycerate kinase [Pseudoflavonifractor sp. MSJ-30]|uniref:phosphoglycerate kinase n=1 Tax=Pseudoflavonifractor sp. MSJ-30 TaxID=2841525 RepID=UPI001C1168C4|nr:phosphoglycerate kinase [Pseudoflavonifractor sp. MSJ-30]MBU5451926.1 phosphoglycerate kinase [Pseudoflavonifractor sp. MSJ-30]
MNYNKKSIEDVNVSGKRVLCRCDFNVPTKNGKITSDKRIVAAMPTIKYLVDHNAKVILCSHMGKPKGEWKPELSLKVVADRISELLGKPVIMAKDVVGEDAKAKAAALKDGEVMLLENTRFEKGETKNDPELSKALASMADLFVNDAFGTAHRAHSSTAGVADYLPAVCGYLVQKEVSIMGKALADPERPFVAILGGAKVSDKLNVINNLLEKVDTLIIGGGMAFTFLAAKGYNIGKSLVDSEKIDYCKEMMAKAEAKGVKLLLPVDAVVAASFPDPIDGPIDVQTVPADAIPADKMGLDIGEKSQALFADAAKSAKTVVWNGPMGVFENPTLAKGTIAVAQALAESSAVTIVGGGDSAAACEQLGFADKITHISTGGGASLEFLEGLELPGIACLQDK